MPESQQSDQTRNQAEDREIERGVGQKVEHDLVDESMVIQLEGNVGNDEGGTIGGEGDVEGRR